jgi:hypothetical protein
MNDEYRQQALDNFRNILARLEQSGFRLSMVQNNNDFCIKVWDVIADISINDITTSISNHTLRLVKKK